MSLNIPITEINVDMNWLLIIDQSLTKLRLKAFGKHLLKQLRLFLKVAMLVTNLSKF